MIFFFLVMLSSTLRSMHALVSLKGMQCFSRNNIESLLTRDNIYVQGYYIVTPYMYICMLITFKKKCYLFRLLVNQSSPTLRPLDIVSTVYIQCPDRK